jgi:hypothetical protein
MVSWTILSAPVPLAAMTTGTCGCPSRSLLHRPWCSRSPALFVLRPPQLGRISGSVFLQDEGLGKESQGPTQNGAACPQGDTGPLSGRHGHLSGRPGTALDQGTAGRGGDRESAATAGRPLPRYRPSRVEHLCPGSPRPLQTQPNGERGKLQALLSPRGLTCSLRPCSQPWQRGEVPG